MTGFFCLRDDGAELFVRLTPRSSRDAIDGVGAGGDGRSHLAARVRAVPEKGAANAALEKLVAAALRVPQRSVQVSGGATARLKTLHIAGDPREIGKKLDELYRAARST